MPERVGSASITPSRRSSLLQMLWECLRRRSELCLLFDDDTSAKRWIVAIEMVVKSACTGQIQRPGVAGFPWLECPNEVDRRTFTVDIDRV